jgi:hypothetical protein
MRGNVFQIVDPKGNGPVGRGMLRDGLVKLVCLGWLAVWPSAVSQADEPVRVAARDVPLTRSSTEVFLRAPMVPQTDMDFQNGYAAVRVSELAEHPLVAAVWRVYEARLDAGEQGLVDLRSTGLEPHSVRTLQFVPNLGVRVDPSAEKPNSLTLGGSDIYMETEGEVDWPEVLRICVPIVYPGLAPETLREMQEAVEPGNVVRLYRATEEPNVWAPLMREVRERVAGGVAECVVRVPAAMHIPESTAESKASAAAELVANGEDASALDTLRDLVKMSEVVGAGLDFNSKSADFHIRVSIAAKPEHSVTALRATVERCLESLVRASETNDPPLHDVAGTLRNARLQPANYVESPAVCTLDFRLPVEGMGTFMR